MNHRKRIMCQLPYKRLARGASVRYFASPLESLVSSGSPVSPAFLGWDPLPPHLAARFVTPTHYSHRVCDKRLYI